MSRAVARLEDRLNARLFHRTTRKVSLSPTGRIFLDHCTRLIQERNEALALVREQGEPRGVLRVTCSIALGERYISPIARPFAVQHPQLRLFLDLSNRVVDLLEAGENTAGLLRYDRATAFRLYQALFGDPAVAARLAGKRRWILVPEGPLLSLNFAALVATPPPGGVAGDFEPAALRSTRWLELDKVLAVVPSVDALRHARKGRAANTTEARIFYGIGDPAFRSLSDPPGQLLSGIRRGAPETAASPQVARQELYEDGAADPAMLARLPRLDYSAAQVTGVANLLHAPPDRLRLQLAATQRALEQSSADGSLGRSGLVLFTTHGLVAGSFDGSPAEPALALTPGPAVLQGRPDARDDGLLTASEIAQLQFNSALVILSACNTASGAEGGDGFSGLARGLLLAGASAVLATYSPVVDEVGPPDDHYHQRRCPDRQAVRAGPGQSPSTRSPQRRLDRRTGPLGQGPPRPMPPRDCLP